MGDRRAGLGPVLWLLSAQYFAAQVAVAAAWPRPYSWSANTISDLGNTRCAAWAGRPVCSPDHVLMDASLVVLGLTMLGGAVVIGRSLGGRRLAAVGFGCLGLAGAGTVVVGLVPENTLGAVHAAGAALPFVLGNAGVVLAGATADGLGGGLRAFSVLAGAVGVVGLVLFLAHTYAGLGEGGMERVTAYPQDVWLIVVGGCLLRRTKLS